MSRASLVVDEVGELILQLRQVGNSIFVISWLALLCMPGCIAATAPHCISPILSWAGAASGRA